MLPEPVLHLFRSQAGVAGRHQIRSVLPDPNARRRVYRHPDVDRVTPRVLRHLAAPPTRDQDVTAAVLDAGSGAQLWAKSAATLWGFGRDRLLPAHVAVPRRHQKHPPLGHLHLITDLDPHHCTRHLGIPVARPEMVVRWLAGALTHRFGHEIALARTEVVLDQAWRQRLIDGRFIHELAAETGGKGRSGIIVLRQALETRPPDYQPAGSRLEERFESIVSPEAARLLRRQVTVDAEPVVRTVDYGVDGRPVILEINGEAWHTSLTDRAADEERYERLLSLGFSVVVFWEYDIWHDAGTVRRALDHALRNPDPVPTLHRPTPAPWQC